MGLFTKVFGTYSQRELKSIYPIVDKITALEDEYRQLTDAELQAKTPEFKERLANGETLDDILPEAFAAVREAADRVLGMRPYPVQLVGGIVLHQGRIAEMKTGEGKTLVATLPAYLNALTGEGVHIVTVNDYLAKRDSEWMGKVHRFMGLTVGLIIHDMKKEERQKAYQADITYGTNNEMGFDYLRDNMALYANEQVQRGHAFAIVDEVDSILIDEARTPLIISGMGEKSTQLYDMAEMFAARLKKFVVVESDDKEEEATDIDADYVVDEKARSVTLTARGVKKAEEFFHLDNLSDPENSTIAHHINQAIKAHGIMKRDVDYVVKDGEVVIVDEFTGRAHVRPPVLRGSAPGHRGQGAPVRPAREQDACHHHVPKLLPPLPQAVRHDRYGADGGGGIRHHLRAGHHRDPHQPPHRPYRQRGQRVQDRERQVPRRHPAGKGVPRQGPAGAGGHRVHREERAAGQDADPRGHQA